MARSKTMCLVRSRGEREQTIRYAVASRSGQIRKVKVNVSRTATRSLIGHYHVVSAARGTAPLTNKIAAELACRLGVSRTTVKRDLKTASRVLPGARKRAHGAPPPNVCPPRRR